MRLESPKFLLWQEHFGLHTPSKLISAMTAVSLGSPGSVVIYRQKSYIMEQSAPVANKRLSKYPTIEILQDCSMVNIGPTLW